MEQGTTDQLFAPPYHPYTEALLSAVPIADTSVTKKHIVLEGELPSPMNPPPGCPFQTRCPRKIGAICETELPPVLEMAPGHLVMCHLDESILRAMEPVIAYGEKGGGGEKFAEDKARRSAVRRTAKAKPSTGKAKRPTVGAKKAQPAPGRRRGARK